MLPHANMVMYHSRTLQLERENALTVLITFEYLLSHLTVIYLSFPPRQYLRKTFPPLIYGSILQNHEKSMCITEKLE